MIGVYSLLPVIVDYELQQKREEGCDTLCLQSEFDAWLLSKGCIKKEVFFAIDNKELVYNKDDDEILLPIYKQLLQMINPEEDKDHPTGLQDILRYAPKNFKESHSHISELDLYNKIYGGWLGRAAGCTLGKPVELWPHEQVISYLKLLDAYPLEYYVPGIEPMPEGFKFKEGTEGALRDNIEGTPRDDDMDYPILNLQVIEKYGPSFSTEDIAQEWLQTMPYKMVYTAERVAYKNVIEGKISPETATHCNPYREWIGAQIRADLWGWVNPGNPHVAAEMAYRDATLSHTKNGVYGEMWMSAMISIAFIERDAEQVLQKSLSFIPPSSRLAKAIKQVRQWWVQYENWEDCFRQIREHYGDYNAVHTINNAAIVTMALLYSKGDLHKGITIAVMAGWDTDCNAASVGSILGVMNGADTLPLKWISPLQDRIISLVVLNKELKLSDLATRTVKCALNKSLTHKQP